MHSRQIPPFLPPWKNIVPAFWIVFLAWVALLVYASSQPGKTGPDHPVIYIDKIEHFLFFASGAMSFGAAIRATFPIRWSTLFLVVIVSFGMFGLADEIHQMFVTGRSGGDPFDWLADLTGTCCGLAFLRTFYAKRPRENPGAAEADREA
ncbi:MAG: VanZ family protein [Terrimicrobiaceae bacterium]|jgi:VanZ family protein